MNDIRLEIVSPVRTVVTTSADSVTLPGTKGLFQVLKDHAPLISSLEKGDIVWVSGGSEERLAISSGFVEVGSNKVIACVEI
ncbi:MAG: hypothetical protein IK143_04855 [Bacteroidales bacterium]|nr:hypothetical protein [Bacteroidales bacterium]